MSEEHLLQERLAPLSTDGTHSPSSLVQFLDSRKLFGPFQAQGGSIFATSGEKIGDPLKKKSFEENRSYVHQRWQEDPPCKQFGPVFWPSHPGSEPGWGPLSSYSRLAREANANAGRAEKHRAVAAEEVVTLWHGYGPNRKHQGTAGSGLGSIYPGPF